MCVQSIPISKKMGDLPGCRENLIPKLLPEQQERHEMPYRISHEKQWQCYQNDFDEDFSEHNL